MLNKKEIKENNIKIRTSKKITLSLLFELIFIILFVLYFDEIKTTQDKFIVFIFAGSTLFLFIRLLWFIFGFTYININNKCIQIQKTLLIKFSKKEFLLSEISEIKKEYNQNKSTYWSFGGLMIYEKDPFVVVFKNKLKKIIIRDITKHQADLIIKKLNSK